MPDPVATASDWRGKAASVSVVVPTFNRVAMLRECIDSLLDQTYKPYEIIVVDDGSTDATAALLQGYGSAVSYLYKENGGKAAALNFALPAVHGEWVWFLDDDDVALPRSIEARLRAIENCPEADIVISRFLWGSSSNEGTIVAGDPLIWPAFSAPDFYPKFLRSCFAHLNGALVRRERLLEVGGFRTDLLTSEDYELTLRVARGGTIAICDEPTFVFRQHTGARGPSGQQYTADQRLHKFAEGDAEIGRWIRSTHELGEYLGFPRDRSLDEPLLQRAVLARLVVMGGKGLPKELADDALALCTILDRTGRGVDQHIAEAIKGALQERYLTMRMIEAPREMYRLLSQMSASPAGRTLLGVISRALLGLAWWQDMKPSDRVRLAAMALRLRFLTAVGTLREWFPDQVTART